MNTYIFKLDSGKEIKIEASTRVVAMEIFETFYYDRANCKWTVNLVDIGVMGYGKYKDR